MILEKREEKEVNLKRLQTGVDKIDSANEVVANLQEELTKLAPFIAEKIKEADELMPIVVDQQGKAEVIKEKVAGEETVVRKQAEEVGIVQASPEYILLFIILLLLLILSLSFYYYHYSNYVY